MNSGFTGEHAQERPYNADRRVLQGDRGKKARGHANFETSMGRWCGIRWMCRGLDSALDRSDRYTDLVVRLVRAPRVPMTGIGSWQEPRARAKAAALQFTG